MSCFFSKAKEREPEEATKTYTVLLHGPDGCGKTSFVKRLLKKEKPRDESQGFATFAKKVAMGLDVIEFVFLDVPYDLTSIVDNYNAVLFFATLDPSAHKTADLLDLRNIELNSASAFKRTKLDPRAIPAFFIGTFGDLATNDQKLQLSSDSLATLDLNRIDSYFFTSGKTGEGIDNQEMKIFAAINEGCERRELSMRSRETRSKKSAAACALL